MLTLTLMLGLVLEPFVKAKGFVLDSGGAVIRDAKVTYQRDLSGETIAMVAEDHGVSEGVILTGNDGGFEARIHPGLYDVCVMADSFTPKCVKAEVTDKKPSLPTFRLRVDPIVTKRIGDRFPSPKRK